MRNVLKILKRDLLRLLKTPQALVVVFALMVIPSLYTWYNVIGFWNPYDNTGNLTVFLRAHRRVERGGAHCGPAA